ncbi:MULTISPECIES: amino acid adenylation domain-containing protein [unclassified Micromonospora]|uniref:non-ribosomal peptide synthetase n=1 Tax=unclassified Micromonospora TaxID=2617518 RepID=UPI00362C8489
MAGTTREVPVTPAQHSLLFIQEVAPRKDLYNISFRLLFDGEPDERAVRAALARMLRIQPSLRTGFDISGGTPRAVVAPAVRVPLEVRRTTDDPARWPDLLDEESHRFARLPLDLAEPPLCRFRLLTGPGRGALLCTIHHTVSDGYSMNLFLDDFVAGYRLALGEPVADLPPEPDVTTREEQFAREQAAQVTAAQAAVADGRAAELAARLADVPPTLLHPVPERPVDTNFDARSVKRWLTRAQWEDLERTARGIGTTPFTVLLACYSMLLGAYSGNSRVVVGSPFLTRRTVAAYDLCGFFLNTLPLVLPAGTDDATFAGHCREVADTVREAKRYQAVSFDALVTEIGPDRSSNRNPLFQCMFAMQDALVTRRPVTAGLSVAVENVSNDTARFDLWLGATPTDDGLELELEYDVDLFPASFAGRFADEYRQLLDRVVADPTIALARLSAPVRGDAPGYRPHRLDHAAAEPGPGIYALVQAAAERTPDAVAVTEPGRPDLTYRDLLDRAERAAAGLHAYGVRVGDIVGITPRTLHETTVAIMAILRCGAAYLPLDLALPADRLAYMLGQAGSRLVVGRSPVPDGPPAVSLAELETAADAPAGIPPAAVPTGAEPAYVIFTSGSTGRPKGVHMGQGPLLNLLHWQVEALGMGPDTRFLQYAQLGFDVSYQEILPTLAAGGTVCGLGDVDRRDFAAVARFVESARLTHVYLPVAALGAFADAVTGADLGLDQVRWICVSGEQLHLDSRSRALLGRLRGNLMNLYGPTETHAVTYHVLPGGDAGGPAHVPIGAAVPGVNVYLLDPTGRDVPPGAVGEVHLGGVCPALGYVNDPERTAAGFLLDPRTSTAERPARMYRTGDLAILTEDGTLVFLGRRDSQVKIRGNRVELGEVEVAAERQAAVHAAAAAVHGSGESAELVLFVRAAGGHAVDDRAICAELATLLPGYAVPKYVVGVGSIPLTANGKVDRVALLRDFDRPAVRAAGQADGGTGWTPEGTERVVAEMWAERIGRSPGSAADSFFALGGNSFEALRFLVDLHRATGARLSAGDFFRAPTVGAVAAAVAAVGTGSGQPDGAEEPRLDRLVTLGGPPAVRPALAVHAVGGGVTPYLGLATALAPDLCLHALRAEGLVSGETPRDSVTAMADAYLRTVDERLDGPPELLVGWSMGGLVAWELARRWAERGTVVPVVLVDTYPGELMDVDGYTQDPARELRVDLAGTGQSVAAGPDFDRLLALFTAHLDAIAAYRPEPAAVPLLLVTGAGGDDARPEAVRRFWAGLARDRFTHVPLAGDHYSLLSGAGVERVAAAIADLRAVPAAGGG